MCTCGFKTNKQQIQFRCFLRSDLKSPRTDSIISVSLGNYTSMSANMQGEKIQRHMRSHEHLLSNKVIHRVTYYQVLSYKTLTILLFRVLMAQSLPQNRCMILKRSPERVSSLKPWLKLRTWRFE